jgi:hypothetical protein
MITYKSTILTQSVRASARKASAPAAMDWLGVALFGVCAIAACSLVANTAPRWRLQASGRLPVTRVSGRPGRSDGLLA